MTASLSFRRSTASRARHALALMAAATLIVAGRQSGAQGTQGAQGAQGEAPLAGFAAQRVAVLPVQFLRTDSMAPVKSADWAGIRSALDDSIGAAIAERGIGRTWAYAADIARMAKRNMGYASDPYALGATALRNRPLKVDDPAPQIVVNNLRSLIALGDARYALIPVELSFVRAGGETRPVLRLVMVDGRMGRVVWFADVTDAPGTAFAAAELGLIAQRIADLVAGR